LAIRQERRILQNENNNPRHCPDYQNTKINKNGKKYQKSRIICVKHVGVSLLAIMPCNTKGVILT
jgi:uncharacterized membrane protein